MISFKVGDKVRRVTDSYWPEDFGYKGEVYTVKEEQNGGIVIINNFSCCSSNFELAEEEKEPTETKFKVGDRVKRVVLSIWPERYGELGSIYTVLSVNFEGNIAVINKDNHANRYFYELVEEKPVYEVGEVYLWKGGECPLPKGTQVDIRLGRSDMSTIDDSWSSSNNATRVSWEHKFCGANIVMFKVVSYPKPEPVKRSVTLELTEEQLKAVESVLLKEGRL